MDVELANYEVKRWLRDVANQRIHATTGEIPNERLDEEKRYLHPLPCIYLGKTPVSLCVPRQDATSFQHPLALYDGLLKEIHA